MSVRFANDLIQPLGPGNNGHREQINVANKVRLYCKDLLLDLDYFKKSHDLFLSCA